MTINWEDEEAFREACKNANSKAGVLRLLGGDGQGGAFKTLKKYAEKYGVVLPDGTGTSMALERRRISLEKILVENSTYTSFHRLKPRLIKAGLMKERCYDCGLISEWNNKPLVLQLDHINGVRNDNRIENLRLLCPNCHSQTETWGTKRFKKV